MVNNSVNKLVISTEEVNDGKQLSKQIGNQYQRGK